MKARRTTDAIPQRGSAGIISEGNGGLKWRTNFSKTSSERNVHALRLFLPPPAHSPLLSLFILPLCCVSETTPLFYQINISQNKSQDNFKLAGEEKRSGVRRRGGGSVRAPPVKWSLRLLPHLVLRSVVLSFASAPYDEVVTTAHECQRREQGPSVHARRAFTYLCHKQKSSST